MDTSKRVLIITSHYYPSNNPPSQRVGKFAKYLPKFGWEPVAGSCMLKIRPEGVEPPTRRFTRSFITRSPSVPSLRSVMLIHVEVNHGKSKLYIPQNHRIARYNQDCHPFKLKNN